jgi:aminopeptidase N
VADIVDTDAVRNNFDGITYAKGASVLRQLAAWVGDDAFIAGLREYFPRHAFGNAELRDFLAALESASGRPLGPWAHEWLQTAGVATLRPVTTTDGGTYGAAAVVQEPAPEHPVLRSHRIGLGLYDLGDDGLVLRRRIEQDVEGDHTPVPDLNGEPVSDLLLLNDGDLAYAKIRLDEQSIATLGEHMGRLQDPLARALCWGSLWDMARDAELPARRYVAIVGHHAQAESDIGVLGVLLARLQAAVDRYSAPDNRGPLRTALADDAWEAMHNAEPGSDAQLVWARTFAASAQSEEQLRTVRGVLDGESKVKGLAVDTDLRWHLLIALASAGAADEDMIAAEAQRDPTDQGRRRAATARAARPDAEAKSTTWEAVLAGDRTPLALKRSLCDGFGQYGQDEILRPYGRRYLEALPQIWDDRGAEESLLLTASLFPITVIDEETMRIADAALDLTEVPEPGKRVILEARDATQRALRARAADA